MVLSASRTKELHVLIVNYFAAMKELAGWSLASLGISSVSMAAGAVDAVQQIKDGEHFDLIIADWTMPNMTGLELLEYARSEQKLKDPPVFNDYRGGYQAGSHRCCKSWCLPVHRKTSYHLRRWRRRLKRLFRHKREGASEIARSGDFFAMIEMEEERGYV